MWRHKDHTNGPTPLTYALAPIIMGEIHPEDLESLGNPVILNNGTAADIGLPDEQCFFAQMTRMLIEVYVTRPGCFEGLHAPLNLAICNKPVDNQPTCNALTTRFRTSDGQDAYLILINIESGGIIERGVNAILGALGEEGVAVLVSSGEIDWRAIRLHSILCGQMFLFFHELSHVVRDHLYLLDTAALEEANEVVSDREGTIPRRVLETDADHLASYLLRSTLPQFFRPGTRTIGDPDRLRFACVLIGLFAVCGAMASVSPDANQYYHSPLMRMVSAAKRLDDSLDGKSPDGDTLIKAFYEHMQASALKNEPLLAAWAYDPDVYAADQASWRVTETTRARLEAAGAFDRLWK